ncbi:MAG: B12-binding domain-containing radical SAM protein [Candidatus Omnitrophota bacterium]
MNKNILLVNPWICDFAAYDLWIVPLGLLNIAACLKAKGINLQLLDLLNRFEYPATDHKNDKSITAAFGTGHFLKREIPKPKVISDMPRKFFRYGIPEPAAREKLSKIKPDIILVTSGMTYWYVGIQQTIDLMRSVYGNECPIILGGTYATLCPEHAQANTKADIVFRGTDIPEIIKCVNQKLDIKIKEDHNENIFPAFELLTNTQALPVLASLGCPFQCTYCASRLLYPEFKQRQPGDLIAYLQRCVSEFKTKDFIFYDDALFVNSDKFIKLVLKGVIEKKLEARFHTPNGLHARFIDQELAQLMYRSGFKSIRLSLESSGDFLKTKSSSKVTNEHLKNAVKLLQNAGFTKSQIGVYTLAGFPGHSPEDIQNDMEFVSSLGASVHLSSFSLVPRTEEWESFINKGMITKDTDPLRLGHTAFPVLYAGFEEAQMRQLRRRAAEFNRK